MGVFFAGSEVGGLVVVEGAEGLEGFFLSGCFLDFFGAEVAKSQMMVTLSFVAWRSVWTTGIPVSLVCLSMPTRGAGSLKSSIGFLSSESFLSNYLWGDKFTLQELKCK